MDRILVVDDDQTWRKILGDQLRSAGYYVDTVSSLAEAMEKLEDQFFHVVITDISLDQEKAWNDDGVRLLQWVRERYPSTKTIAISGRSVSGLDKKGFEVEYGALQYIERIDFKPRQFLEYVAEAVQLSKEVLEKG